MSQKSKRELIEPHAGDKRYVCRKANGTFGKTVDVGRSLAPDKLVAQTASKTRGDLAEFERNPSLTKTSEDLSTEFSFPYGAVKNQVFAIGVATAASFSVPSWKTILDLTCILLSIPLWLPIVLFLALWIKLASPGPVFFRQERVGHRGKRFMILKFRTMKVNVKTRTHERHLEQLSKVDAPMTKLDAAGGPRIIPGGRILRATGLDELPQLFNVLRGEMSFVGPLPCTPHKFKTYQVWQRERVNARPGLTGFSQVNGKNRTTSSEMIKLDIFYTRQMSLWLDLTIMLKTLPPLINRLSTAIPLRVPACWHSLRHGSNAT
jgi:lipopolysaccharide/colanic/teichoic acid biosynthesis glycosyltransferase